MSRKYSQIVNPEICAYCGKFAGTADHVIARKFFPVEKRDNLPQVPACSLCNGDKAALEHYLISVLPFAAQHEDALKILAETVPSRLEQNQKLRRELGLGFRHRYVWSDGGPWKIAASLSFQGEKLEQYLSMVVRGLACHHWGIVSDERLFAQAAFVREKGRNIFDEMMLGGSTVVAANLGNGIFEYAGARMGGESEFTIWKMSLCGVEMNPDETEPQQKLKHAHGFTVPKSLESSQYFIDLVFS